MVFRHAYCSLHRLQYDANVTFICTGSVLFFGVHIYHKVFLFLCLRISLSIMASKSIRVASDGRFSVCLWLNSILLYIYIVMSIFIYIYMTSSLAIYLLMDM